MGKIKINYRKMLFNIRNGQSALEYVIILAVVVGVIVAAAVTFRLQIAEFGVF